MTSFPDKPYELHATMLAPPDPMIGATIDGRYYVESALGEGGMGLVYRVRHVILKRPLAIKVLRPEVSSNPQVLARFKQEAQSASAIGNQHIIDVVDFGLMPDGSTYFVMEFLDGLPLSTVIERESPVSIPRVVHVARQLCDALGAAHGVGIVHRDLKPDNIFLVRRGSESDFVKVLDFGIAKVGGTASKLTQQGQVFGTPHYMAPEQCQGLSVDGRADLYSLGIILYELVTGALPFDSESLIGLISAHLTEPPPPPSSKRPDCPAGLEAILMRCLEKSPETRYQDCAELLADIEGFASGIPTWVPPRVSGIVESRAPRSIAPASEYPRPHSFTPSSAAPKPANPATRIVFAVAALIALAGVGALVFAGVVESRIANRVEPPRVVVLPQSAIGSPQTATPQAAPIIRLETEPHGSEVLENGELIGVTPLEIPRPQDAQRRTLVLRSPGHESREVTVTAATVGSPLRFTLRREGGSNRGSRTYQSPGGRAEAPAAEAAQPIQDSTPPRRRASSEVINPWGN